jgi:hypothetical protein
MGVVLTESANDSPEHFFSGHIRDVCQAQEQEVLGVGSEEVLGRNVT